jgi:hypothetical protein
VIARKHLRPHVAYIVDELWHTRHLGTTLSLVTKIASGVPDDFRLFVLRLVRRILASLDILKRLIGASPMEVRTRRFQLS